MAGSEISKPDSRIRIRKKWNRIGNTKVELMSEGESKHGVSFHEDPRKSQKHFTAVT